jgi:hypothetical protein
MGSWQATSQLEWDIVQEVFAPFNCRALIIYMLGVNVKYRSPFNNRLHKGIVRKLWPLMLTVPRNPIPLHRVIVRTIKLLKAKPAYIFIKKQIKMVLRKLKSA